MSPRTAGRLTEARFFTTAGRVDEATFWAEVERLAALGARARFRQDARGRILGPAVCWRLRGRTVVRLLRAREGRR
jgi:hypothetical protein